MHMITVGKAVANQRRMSWLGLGDLRRIRRFGSIPGVAAQRRKPSRDHLGGGQPPGGGLCLFFAALATRLGVGFVGLPIGIIVVAGPRVNLRPANLTAEGP